jgi:shikimate dehydrogenase
MAIAGEEYRQAREISGKTRVYAHLAHPSGHVRAPQVFNRAFRARGIDAVTVSIDVAPDDLHAMVSGLHGWRNLAGIGVTTPHKETIVAEVDEIVGLARYIKAINNIRREQDGRLIGTNTDGAGFVAGLKGAGRDPSGRRVLLVGVGGAGRAIAFALVEAGVASLGLANRTRARAERLAGEIEEVFSDASVNVVQPDPAGYDLVVNATTLGMRDDDELPFDVDHLAGGTIVADVVVAVPKTRLMHEAERRGCVPHPGQLMLEGQVDQVIKYLRLEPVSNS